MKIKVLKTVQPDFPFWFHCVPFDTVLVCGEVYQAVRGKSGAVCGICENGQMLGVKPEEFEVVQENA